ncbi:MAG: dockerin type I domain-containing protein [Ruminiclostridium sp.]
MLGTTTSINQKNSDMNSDGEVNSLDFAHLKLVLLNQ